MISFAHNAAGPTPLPIKDFYAAVGTDTVATQTNGTAGAYTPKKGDIVSLNDQGRVCLAKQGTPSGKPNPYLTGAKVLGVCEGGEFTGLAQGGIYAAKAANNNDMTSGTVAKVQYADSAIYHIDLLPGAAAPVVGVAYAIVIDPNNGAQLDTSNPTGPPASTAMFQVTNFFAGAGTLGSGEALGLFVQADDEIQL